MIFAQFYLDLTERLLELKDSSGKSDIAFIDLWSGQTELNEEGKVESFPRPAVFIEFPDAQFGTLGNRMQEGNIDFDLHVASDVIIEHSSREEDAKRSRALEHLQLCDKIFAHLQNWSGDYFGAVDRSRFRAGFGPGELYEHIITFRTRFVDNAAMRKRFKPVPPNPAGVIQDLDGNKI